MRTIKNLGVPFTDDPAKFPHGQLRNETDTLDGTPVVREIYGDLIVNLYKLLDLAGLAFTEDEDSETSQFQLVDALKLFSNSLNDIEQVLTLSAAQWSVPINLSILPDKYVFFARPSDTYNSAEVYTFKGSGAAPEYSFTSPNGFSSGEEVMVVVDQAGVRAIGLRTFASSNSSALSTAFGTPIAFNSAMEMYFFEDGTIFKEDLSVSDLRNQIRTATGDAIAEIVDVVVLKGYILCFVYLPNTITYVTYQFAVGDLNTAIAVPISGISIPVGTDNQPYLYTDGDFVYITNFAGTTVNDNEVSRFTYTPATPQLNQASQATLNAAFQKTTNAIVKDDQYFYTFISGVLARYEISTGLVVTIGDYKNANGQLFAFNGGVYFDSGDSAGQLTSI